MRHLNYADGANAQVWRGVARVNWDVQDYGYRIVMKIEEELNKM